MVVVRDYWYYVESQTEKQSYPNGTRTIVLRYLNNPSYYRDLVGT